MPAPANDNFASAIALSTTLPGTRAGDTTVDATSEGSEPIVWNGATGVQSVWYTFTPATTGRYRFNIDNTDTVVWSGFRQFGIHLFSGSTIGGLTTLQYHEQNGNSGGPFGGDHVSVVYNLTSGVTYRIRVSSPLFSGNPSNAHTVNYDLHWSQVTVPSAPANDNIANAINLGTNPADGTSARTNKGATWEAWELAGGYGQPSVWFRFHSTITETQEIHAVSDGLSDFRPYWEVYQITTDPPADFTDLTFVDNGSILGDDDFDSEGTVAIVAGNDYAIYVSNWDFNGEWGDFNLIFGPYAGPPTPPANDNRTALNAAPLQFYYPWFLSRSEYVNYPTSSYWTQRQAGFADGTTVAATAEGGEATHAGFAATRSVWYVLDIQKAGNYKIWVESAVDCVLAIYNKPNGTLGTLIAEDDDSGTGNWPEITQSLASGDYWIVVDSKTEGTFRLKWQRIGTGTPPANDNFANATLISSIPFSTTGTTVDATAEADEHDFRVMPGGPKDTVWYKFVATGNGTLKIKCSVQSANGGPDSGQTAVGVDLWRGTTLQNLVRHPEPPTLTKGFFNHFDTAVELDRQAIYLDYVNGQTYYIRVQTPGGGSEDFTIFVETLSVYYDIQPSGVDVGPYNDAAEVYVNINTSGVEDFHQVIAIDAATVPIDIQVSSLEFKAFSYTDVGTVYYNISIDSHDCHTQFDSTQLVAHCYRRLEATSLGRWNGTAAYRRFEVIAGDGLEEC